MLSVIAAVLIGGTAFTGGDGGLLGTVIGVLFLGIVQNGLQLSDVSTFWQGTVSGLDPDPRRRHRRPPRPRRDHPLAGEALAAANRRPRRTQPWQTWQATTEERA